MQKKTQIGIIAPSSSVGQIELGIGVDAIRAKAFSVRVHSQCKKKSLFFAGTDEQRAKAFYEYATDESIHALWAARGGYGAVRLLSILDRLVRERGLPKKRKLLLGYSDVTVLMEYVRNQWGWATLHAPVPGFRRFSALSRSDWNAMECWIRQEEVTPPWENQKLKFWSAPPKRSIDAPLVGGNLTIWSSLLGTPYQARAQGCLVFFEDVGESLYRIDRMLQQIMLSGALKGARGIVLGNFMDCRDTVATILKKAPRGQKELISPSPRNLKPLRPKMKEDVLLRRLFSDFGKQLGLPVAYGLPVGHGPEVSPLPLGARYRLGVDGRIQLLHWDWLDKSRQKA